MGAAMSRYERPAFNIAHLNEEKTDEARNRLIFDWWCDEGDLNTKPRRESDRLRFIAALKGNPEPKIPSRAPLQNDPAPPLTEPAPQGFRDVYLLNDPAHLRAALTDTKNFTNLPYAALGGASFLLGLDPGVGYGGKVDWHAEQKALVQNALDSYPETGLRELARIAVDQAALTSLARPEFDLAKFAEQAALRYMGILFGYGFQDHGLLEEASRTTYRALQYLAIGQHFVTEPGTLPAAQQALGRLVARTSQLMEDYTRLERAKRRYGPEKRRDWPEGVQPWSELGLSSLDKPLLKRLPKLPDPPGKGEKLSGRDRAMVAATLLAGTFGNIQSAVCLLVQSLMTDPDGTKRGEIRGMKLEDELEKELELLMFELPPVPVLPRRTRKDKVTLGSMTIPGETDCLLLLEALGPCPHIWGGVGGSPDAAAHVCLGRALSLPLIAALVHRTLNLPEVRVALDPLNGETPKVKRLWGFACTQYTLRYEQEQQRQQNLIISMRVKAPISENAMRLRQLIAAGVPRINHALTNFGHLHFAWFEFSDDDRQLVLRTIYDGQFEPYVQHFALNIGDLFDGLFEYLEGAPPRPVAEHPQEFVETLRILNRAPLANYLFSAYPGVEADQIRSRTGSQP
jgi:cytochrome P450